MYISLMAIFPGEPGLAGFSWTLLLSPYILFNTITPCPSQTGEGRVVEEKYIP